MAGCGTSRRWTSLTAENEEVTRQINEVNVEGTQRLAEAWMGGRAAGAFYHISTAYVVGDRHGTALETESATGQGFRNPYEASKLAAETRILGDFARGLSGAMFRPSIVVDDAGGTGGFKMVDACAYAVALAVKRGEPFVFRLRTDGEREPDPQRLGHRRHAGPGADAFRPGTHLSSYRAARHIPARYRGDPGSAGAEAEGWI